MDFEIFRFYLFMGLLIGMVAGGVGWMLFVCIRTIYNIVGR